MKKALILFFFLLAAVSAFGTGQEKTEQNFKEELKTYLLSLQRYVKTYSGWPHRQKIFEQFFLSVSESFVENLKDPKSQKNLYVQGLTGGYADLILTLNFYESRIYEGQWLKLFGSVLKENAGSFLARLTQTLNDPQTRSLYLTQWEEVQKQDYFFKLWQKTALMSREEGLKTSETDAKQLLSGYEAAYLSALILKRFLRAEIQAEETAELFYGIFSGK